MENEVSTIVEWASAGVALTGETESGDLHVVKHFEAGILVGVVDGLGHGPEAAFAARKAVAALEEHPEEPLIRLVRRCHESLKGTRGVVMSLASLDTGNNSASWLGIGNVEGILVREGSKPGPRIHRIIGWGGVVGYNLPELRPASLSLMENDLLVFASDGIRQEFVERSNYRDQPQRVADRICTQFGTRTDDALVLVLRYRGLHR
ncbi:MAG TPA: SpoIIE family protein phosphatase [Bacteroidota bacterium]|nr:SpoIIE family protein phosphatase [Bacteroidota bacterium]